MKTIRWLRIKWPVTIADVSKRMLSNQYNENRGRGFILSSSGKQKVSGKFVERILNPSVIVDPFGNETESEVVTYYVSKFSFNRSSSLLELETPPRSIRKFTSELHNMLGLGLELSDIKVDPLEWLQKLEALHSPVQVLSISSSGISVPKNGLAKISVSGKNDIRAEFGKLIGKKEHVIDLVKFKGVFNECHITVESYKSGSIKYGGHIYDGFTDDMKKCLERSISKKS